MPRNGSGTYAAPASSFNPATNGVAASATDWNSLLSDLSTAMSASIAKDGQTTVTANLPMATYRHTGVGDGQSRTDYASLGQSQDGKINWIAGGGTADAITATYSPALTTLVDGQLCFVRATAANATTTPTFAPNGLTARTIVKNGGSALAAGDIAGSGHELILRYLLASTRWELLNPRVSVTDATISISDITTNNVTSTAHGFAPKSPADATKFLNGAATPAYALVKDSDLSLSDITTNNASTSNHGFLKKLPNVATQFMDGTGAWSSPVITVKYTSSDQTITAAGSLSLTHSLGGTPTIIQLYLICQTGELGYSANDIVQIQPNVMDSSGRGISIVPTSTTIECRYGSAANTFVLVNKTSGATNTSITNANWKLRVIAYV